MDSDQDCADHELLARIEATWPQVLNVWLGMADSTTQRIFGRTVPVAVTDKVLVVDAGRFGWNLGRNAATARALLEEALFAVTELRLSVSTDCGPRWWWRRKDEPVVDWELRMAGFLVGDELTMPEVPKDRALDVVRDAEWGNEVRMLAHPRLVGSEADGVVDVCVRWSQMHPDRSFEAREMVWDRIIQISLDPGCVIREDEVDVRRSRYGKPARVGEGDGSAAEPSS